MIVKPRHSTYQSVKEDFSPGPCKVTVGERVIVEGVNFGLAWTQFKTWCHHHDSPGKTVTLFENERRKFSQDVR